MLRQSARPTSSPTPFLYQHPDTLRMAGRPKNRRGFWLLLALGTVLNVAVVALGISLFAFNGRSVAPPDARKIKVPFADSVALWDGLRDWTVQEDGRNKPYDTFCREAVEYITGRRRFEGNDPVAVVTSWVLLYDEDTNKALEQGDKLGCNWETHPFLLCEHHALRKMLYREYHGEGASLTEEQLHGKYIEPWVVRHSEKLKAMLRESAMRMEEDSKAVQSELEKKAQELKLRLARYDRIRSGGQEGRERVHAPGEFGVVALDRRGATWFSLRGVREYLKTPEVWAEVMQARRLADPDAYSKMAPQSLPTEELKQMAASIETVRTTYCEGDSDKFATAFADFRSTVDGVSKTFTDSYPGTMTTALELWFNRADPFRKAWIASLLAGVLLFGSIATRSRWPVVSRTFYLTGLLGYVGSLGWSIAGFYCRVTISGRPPVSNMYESVVWVGFMTAVFGLLLELVFWFRGGRPGLRGVVALAATLVSTLGLVLADQLPLTLSPNIQPLQAVLRSNYWLVIHVLTIVSSYAAFALAWGLGNINLGLMVFAPHRSDLVKTLSNYCYRAIQIGVVLIAAGTLLGGFWAAESWGRFWGWDPKEVWALIALLCYIIPLHARHVGWVKDFGLAACSVVCFASVMMAWYGVNFVLGAGLHSYGFGGGNDRWVYAAGLLNISLVVHAALRYYHGRADAASVEA